MSTDVTIGKTTVTIAIEKRCRKCNGLKVRRHHRKCVRRGLCHKGRGHDARALEAYGQEYGLSIHIRRGRQGKGGSIDAESHRLARHVAHRHAPQNPLRSAIVAIYGRDAKIETPEPGTIAITTDVDADPNILRSMTPWAIRVLVNGVPL